MFIARHSVWIGVAGEFLPIAKALKSLHTVVGPIALNDQAARSLRECANFRPKRLDFALLRIEAGLMLFLVNCAM